MPQLIPLESDILQQPAAFHDLIGQGPARWEGALQHLRLPPGGQIILAGMGSSYMAACGAAISWPAWGIPVRAELASDLLYYGHGRVSREDLVILVSQSGASVEVVKLAESLARDGIATAAVVNQLNSPVGQAAGPGFAMELPPDHGVATKSFGGTLLTLLYLGRRLAGGSAADWAGPAAAAVDALDATMESAGRWRILGGELGGRTAFVMLARGPVGAGGREAALLGNEVVKIPAWFEEAGEFRHGIIEMSEPGFIAGLMVPDGPGAPLQVALIRELAATGATVLATAAPQWAAAAAAAGARVHPVPALAEDFAAIAHLLPFQWLTLGWAEARGLYPGRFRYIANVITDEGSMV